MILRYICLRGGISVLELVRRSVTADVRRRRRRWWRRKPWQPVGLLLSEGRGGKEKKRH